MHEVRSSDSSLANVWLAELFQHSRAGWPRANQNGRPTSRKMRPSPPSRKAETEQHGSEPRIEAGVQARVDLGIVEGHVLPALPRVAIFERATDDRGAAEELGELVGISTEQQRVVLPVNSLSL